VPTGDFKEEVEIIYITASDDELKLGLCLGHRLPNDTLEIIELAFYNRANLKDRFEL
jgi:hypothetical protein